jgi:GxxExxY protein
VDDGDSGGGFCDVSWLGFERQRATVTQRREDGKTPSGNREIDYSLFKAITMSAAVRAFQERMRAGRELSRERVEEIGKIVVDAVIKVHSKLGPGLLESVYEICLAHELSRRGLRVECQVSVPIVYDNIEIQQAYKIDLLVEDAVVLELKTVELVHPKHGAQLLTYMKLSGCRLGFLVNFYEALAKDGIHRRVNNL